MSKLQPVDILSLTAKRYNEEYKSLSDSIDGVHDDILEFEIKLAQLRRDLYRLTKKRQDLEEEICKQLV